MADPFEVRMKFSTYLSHLSANQTSLIKTTHFALKHRSMDEDLHSCILETLEQGKSNMNNRANIMYFLEHHAEVNGKEGGHPRYVEMVKRDIVRIVEAVAQSGANVKVCRRVVTGLGERGVVDLETVDEIERGLRDKEERWGAVLNGDGAEAEDREMLDVMPDRDEKESKKRTNGEKKVDKRAIEQRIEEDRERNKRLRENVWAVAGNDDDELDKMYDESSDLNDDDYDIADEEGVERKQFANYHLVTINT